MSKGRILSAYFFLVGGPLLGLVGILRGGMHLSPPMAVRGNWIVETNFDPWQGRTCEALLTNAPQLHLNIAQSGRELTITLNNPEKTILAGTISDSNLVSAHSVGRQNADSASGAAIGCPDPHSLRMEARVFEQGKEESLKGTISLDGCADCSPLAFSAIRQEPDGRSAR
jgi:hypothetical protein